MTRSRLLTLLLVLALGSLGVLLLTRSSSGESNGTPEARVQFTAGEAARRSGKHAEAVAAFRRAIEIDPDFVEAHAKFIETIHVVESSDSASSDRKMKQLYDEWARSSPRRAVYQWARGFVTKDRAEAETLFRAALDIDPRFARAHWSLAQNADLRGDWDARRHHLRAAVEANPEDPLYLIGYAHAHKNSDPDRFRELAEQVVEKFPDSQAAAEALYHLGNESSNPKRGVYFDRLRARYPADRFGYTGLAMDLLYGELEEPAQALAVARDMTRWRPTSQTWARRAAYQEVLTRAEALLAERKFAEANDALEKAERPSSGHSTKWVLLKAEAAAGSGPLETVYAMLVEAVAATPDDRRQAALRKYGALLKKTSQQIDADIWRVRDAKATLAPGFELPNSASGKAVQLSDYRGRIVLVSFWFPG